MRNLAILCMALLLSGCVDLSSKSEDSIPLTARLKVTALTPDLNETPYYGRGQIEVRSRKMLGEEVLKHSSDMKYPDSDGVVEISFIGTLWRGEHIELCVVREGEELCEKMTYDDAFGAYDVDKQRAFINKEMRVIFH